MRKSAVIFTLSLIPAFAPARELPLPSIPDSLTTPTCRADFILAHFWDDLQPEELVQSPENDTEQNFSNFISLFPHASTSGIAAAAGNLFSLLQNEVKSLTLISEIAEKYLLDTESPFRNEQYFAILIEQFINNPVIPETLKFRPSFLLEDIRKNAEGTQANDFTYITPEGEKSSLHDTPVNGRLIVIFFDPECDDCHLVMNSLSSDDSVNKRINCGELTILAIYAGDDMELWNKSKNTLPTNWLSGFDQGSIDNGELYNFPSTPTLFILDSQYKVLRKNASLSDIQESE